MIEVYEEEMYNNRLSVCFDKMIFVHFSKCIQVRA